MTDMVQTVGVVLLYKHTICLLLHVPVSMVTRLNKAPFYIKGIPLFQRKKNWREIK